MKPMMNVIRWGVGTGLLAAALGVGLFAVSVGVSADRGERDDDDDHERREYVSRQRQVAMLPAYMDECGACHMAYPAGFLPSRSWETLMQGLDDHFGDNAELPSETTAAISAWLQANAGDAGNTRQGYRMLRGIDPAQTPLRITELSYFKREHDEVPARMVAN